MYCATTRRSCSTADDAAFQARVGAFLQGLQQSGWTIGRNVRIVRAQGGQKKPERVVREP
jgi:hypothetical protein